MKIILEGNSLTELLSDMIKNGLIEKWEFDGKVYTLTPPDSGKLYIFS